MTLIPRDVTTGTNVLYFYAGTLFRTEQGDRNDDMIVLMIFHSMLLISYCCTSSSTRIL